MWTSDSVCFSLANFFWENNRNAPDTQRTHILNVPTLSDIQYIHTDTLEYVQQSTVYSLHYPRFNNPLMQLKMCFNTCSDTWEHTEPTAAPPLTDGQSNDNVIELGALQMWGRLQCVPLRGHASSLFSFQRWMAAKCLAADWGSKRAKTLSRPWDLLMTYQLYGN